jgi:hypothetical protein
MIRTSSDATLVEVSVRTGRDRVWLESEASAGRIAARLTGDGWIVSRACAERLVAEWGAR